MSFNKPESCSQCKKLICDWTDKTKDMVHNQLLYHHVLYTIKLYIRQGMIFEKIHDVLFFI